METGCNNVGAKWSTWHSGPRAWWLRDNDTGYQTIFAAQAARDAALVKFRAEDKRGAAL